MIHGAVCDVLMSVSELLGEDGGELAVFTAVN